ncbi:hypothetical protein D9M71_799270 [compost metagenome]
MIAFHRAALQERQLAVILAYAECHDLVGRAAIADIQETPVRRQVQSTRRPGFGLLAFRQG